MNYVCLIYDPAPKSGFEAEYASLVQDALQKNVLRGGSELTAATSATSLRVRDGKRLLSDGPFAETKEVVNGYMIFDCSSLDEAIEWAARIPGAETGCVEIRPTVERPS